MAVVAVVPARSGSKRVPGKNIRLCAGRPLLAWTADAALAAHAIDRVILSSDDVQVAKVGRACGLEVPWLRPTEIASDDSPMIPVLVHVLDWLEGEGVTVEAVVLLQPTSPLRTAGDIDGAIALFRSSGADTVVTVMAVPNACKPVKLMARDTEGLVASVDAAVFSCGQLVLRNGPAVLVTSPGVIRSGRLYGERTLGYEMPQERSIDIDTPYDFLLAELLLAHRDKTA
ncbi:MAG: acylneuraminate cytidylyltransferase family protein [Thermodesulfobacteriota bacterium]